MRFQLRGANRPTLTPFTSVCMIHISTLSPIVIQKDKNSDYGVTVPDLPGCFSAGRTLEEALSAAEEAIELHRKGLMEEGLGLPEPSSIERWRANADLAGRTWPSSPPPRETEARRRESTSRSPRACWRPWTATPPPPATPAAACLPAPPSATSSRAPPHRVRASAALDAKQHDLLPLPSCASWFNSP
jgi:predicted RNase H-like HicB family nuclease